MKRPLMTPKDEFKKYKNDPTRIRLPIEEADIVGLVDLLEVFYMAGYARCQKNAVNVAQFLFERALENKVNIPPLVDDFGIFATGVKAIQYLIKDMHKPLPEHMESETRH